MQGKTRIRGRSPRPKEERQKAAERSRRGGATMKAAGLIDATTIVRAADVALLRRVADTLLEGEIETARLGKLLPTAPEASDPRRTASEEPIPHALRRAAGRVGALSEEGGSAAGVPS